jgi:hypothetical protein
VDPFFTSFELGAFLVVRPNPLNIDLGFETVFLDAASILGLIDVYVCLENRRRYESCHGCHQPGAVLRVMRTA